MCNTGKPYLKVTSTYKNQNVQNRWSLFTLENNFLFGFKKEYTLGVL